MALIKSHHVRYEAEAPATVDKLNGGHNPLKLADIADPRPSKAELEVARLKQALETQEQQIADHGAAIKAAEARGRKAGLEAATRSTAAALELLTDGIDRAISLLADDLKATEQLAVGLADAALAAVFGSATTRRAMVEEIIQHQLSKLARTMVLHVDVSAGDFDTVDHLAAEGVVINRRSDLGSGDCQIKLRLGTIDASLDRQWQAIRNELVPITDGVVAT